jgi:ferredoxin
MDKFFSGDFLDNYYLERRENTLIISLACNEPMDTCFCICCDGGPWLESGFDLQLTDLGDNFLVEVGTDKGVDVLKKLKGKAPDAGEEHLAQRDKLMAECDSKMIPKAYVAKTIIQITNDRVREELWDEMGLECFSCGGCTHVCPICTCFDVADRMESAQSGVRARCWDSCQYSGFTREASGHNPRDKTKERIKRRFYHKFSYQYVKLDGHHGCVGCGRCVTVCEAIGMLDVPAVVQRLRRDGQPEPETTEE